MSRKHLHALPRRAALFGAGALIATSTLTSLPRNATAQDALLQQHLADADRLVHLRTITIAQGGEILSERSYHGHNLITPTNIKSASKVVMGALIGIAVERGILDGPEQPIAPILSADLPANPDPRIHQITIGNLLTMQSGLLPTSGAEYGRWVSSNNWVRAALAQPFVDNPGGRMLYSTGSTHLLSAILTRLTGRSALALSRDWMVFDGFSIDSWERDPQGNSLGGNEMAMRPKALLAFGEIYRRGGVSANGIRILSPYWVEQSWTAHTSSRWSGDGYGYGWFMRTIAGEAAYFAWGYGGQMLYVVPNTGLTVAMTSDATPRSTTIADRDNLHVLMGNIIRATRAG